MRPLVSIVIPVYNVEKYLHMCLESVLAQTYENYEVILVNDGSTDISGQICDKYVQENNNFSVIHQKNMGLSSARNVGLVHISGKYVYFLDSDDCIYPKLLEIVTDIAEEKETNIVQVGFKEVSEDFSFKQIYEKEEKKNFPIYEFTLAQSLYNLDSVNKETYQDIKLSTIVVWTKLYRASIFQRVKFVDNIRLHEDQLVIHRFLIEADGMIYCDIPLYYYRNNGASLMRSGWTTKRLFIFECYKDRLDAVLALPNSIKEKSQLIYFFYKRYLLCMFRNYMMVDIHLTNEGKRKQKQVIIKRMKNEMKQYDISLHVKDMLIFRLFFIMPDICIKLFEFRNRIQEARR